MGKILVIGSSNTDLIATMNRFPAPGESIVGSDFLTAMGGKGANQAVAAFRLGGDVSFIASLGTDVNGQTSLEYYKQQGLDVSMSQIVDGVPSGTAVIWVDETGENSIVYIPGANNKLSPEYIQGLEDTIKSAGMLVLQMEIPYETVSTICKLAQKHGRKVMLNVAPARKVDEVLLQAVEILVVNETEAEIITGRKLEENNVEEMVDLLLSMGSKVVLLTLGDKGCFLKTGNEKYIVPAFKVSPVDTTAAGDTFCGAVAAEYMRGKSWNEILEFASAAAAISVTRMGAQPSIPDQSEVQQFLNN